MARKAKNDIEEAWRHSNNIVSPFLSAKEDKEEAEAYFHEPRLFIENFLFVPNKEQEIVPFKFKLGQTLVYDIAQKIDKLGKPVRIINLKNRRCGFSSVVSAYLYTKARFSHYFDMRTVSLDLDSAGKIMSMYFRYHDMLPEEMRPLVARRKVDRLLVYGNNDPDTRYRYPGLQCSIQAGTARNMNLGRGEGNRALHVTESAFFPSMSETMRALLKTVPPRGGTHVFNETTSDGLGGDFYDAFIEARARLKVGDWEWYPIFLPSWLDEDCHPYIPQDQIDMVLNTLDDYEKLMIRQYSMVDANYLWWRRNQVTECGGSVAVFNLEGAPSVDEAFAAQGQSVFPPSTIEFYFKNTVKPGRTGKLVVPDAQPGRTARPHFVDDPKGSLTIWEFPGNKLRYAMGADASMGQRGAEAEASMQAEYETDYDPDYCAAVVLSEDYRQVAELRVGMMDPESFAEEVAALGFFYNECRIMPEVGCQGAGIGMMYRLKEIYHNLGMWEDVFNPHTNKKKSIGWEANAKTKPILLGKAVRAVLHGAGLYQTSVNPAILKSSRLIIRSAELVREMSDFAVLKNGSFGSRHGHDDLVIGLCLAILTLKDYSSEGKPLPENTKRLAKEEGMCYTPMEKHPAKQSRKERTWLDL